MSKILVNYFANSLQRSFAGPIWYGSTVHALLNRIEDANVRYADKYSLGQILEHMIAWKQYGIEKLNNNETFSIEIGSEADWKSDATYTKEEIIQLIQSIRAKQNTLIELLKTKDDEWLKNKVPGKAEYDFEMLIEGLLQHDIYHIGQIAMLLPMG